MEKKLIITEKEIRKIIKEEIETNSITPCHIE